MAFGRLLALGITLLIGLQAAMNIAVVTVAAPTKGIALPLVSAGGSGILFLGASIGLAASVAYHAAEQERLPDRAAPAPLGAVGVTV
jgi:cell division protein FtsW